MADTNIKLIFSGEQSVVGTESDPTVPGATPNPEEPEKVKEGGKEKGGSLSTAKLLAMQMGKQAFNAAVSRVGVATRNSLAQEKVNYALKRGGQVLAIGAAVATQNYAMALVMVGSMVVEDVTDSIEFNRNAKIESKALSIRLATTGSTNRSR